MTTVDSLFHKDCDKIPAADVDAYIDLTLDPENPTGVILDHSWGTTKIDLEPVVKAGETVTHLMLDPEVDPIYLRYDNEAGDSECIHGDDLSRIISLKYLKDVDQNTRPINGDVYMYNSEDGKFYTFNLQNFVNATNNHLSQHDQQIQAINQTLQQLQNYVDQLNQRIEVLENLLVPPANAPSGVKVAWGNINLYSDKNNTNSKNSGLYTHDLNSNVTNDEMFA